MSVAFWSVTIKAGKSTEVQPPEGYVLNVCQVALTGKSASPVHVKVIFFSCIFDCINI